MKHLISIPFIFILYIFRIICSTFVFIGKVISNLLEKKCNHNIDDIVAITYYSEEWPDLVAFTLYYDEKNYPKYLKKLESDPMISKKDFDYILERIKKNNILKKKKYILNWPYVSLSEYFSWYFACDAGPTTQSLTLHFNNGDSKYITGYSEDMDNLRKAFEKILPREKFW